VGWTHVEGSLDDPAVTGRASFGEVIQEAVLRAQLRALNPGPDGQPWLDDGRLSEAVAAITRLGTPRLMEANERATALLIQWPDRGGPARLGRRARPDAPLHRLGALRPTTASR
jgi:type I restriction enzyme R subunit